MKEVKAARPDAVLLVGLTEQNGGRLTQEKAAVVGINGVEQPTLARLTSNRPTLGLLTIASRSHGAARKAPGCATLSRCGRAGRSPSSVGARPGRRSVARLLDVTCEDELQRRPRRPQRWVRSSRCSRWPVRLRRPPRARSTPAGRRSPSKLWCSSRMRERAAVELRPRASEGNAKRMRRLPRRRCRADSAPVEQLAADNSHTARSGRRLGCSPWRAHN